MSIYDSRDQAAYRAYNVDRQYAKNPLILSWWTRSHDALIRDAIAEWQWQWAWSISDKIVSVTPEDVLEEWRNTDPLCRTYVWYNVLMYFAEARAAERGLTRLIRKPKWKTCPLCGQRFREDSLPVPLVQRLGIDRIEFCSPCLKETVLQGSGSETASAARISRYLRALSDLIERVPPQNFGEGINDLSDFTSEERLAILRLLREKPSVRRVKTVCGSWLNALIKAGVLEDGTRRTARGTHSIAKDGHICFSLGEKTIDGFLHSHGISHEKEPRYPKSNFRADFEIQGTLVEYFGLTGDPEYDAKTREKERICRKHGILLVSIYPQDLMSVRKLEAKLAPIMQG